MRVRLAVRSKLAVGVQRRIQRLGMCVGIVDMAILTTCYLSELQMT